ncbi:uncharacterized protein (TIGR02145 family) [Parabacteroides sp. PF5-5]|uniref:FISUMP domain-containing protein n=1 Tax=unclassified Parabacteroides TaxID=2649774 RepID=UPI002476D59D|nr:MULTISPECIES: FISUMP domain-containing protein [unclassified Parabacteroides]MDH6303922.1 uncharacterized protein (TIGR02145 family) [Parabacteroides sp. PH5-39]MDH6314539.1 uncharacterized protein (TIGR02145 family) [Parabacteroides sp. PF5-13]MDH6318396.1 uncharacterized protein (TIGR02145 family) [Parabacteroides sp. PH5-13]MDH6322311.1 uncharacterized protein (TIGR02145 family) [Parabacteroides sp. PH5-8]MDH6325609.1 uncharacterized protein (TIGR02145 family) [Parabacteroides sp. PH5-41
MIKQTVFLCLLFGLLLMSACSNETEFSSPIEQSGEGIVTFTLPSLRRGVVSYASIADNSENFLDNFSIYMFNDASKKLEKVFHTPDDIEFGDDAGAQTAKINVTGKSGTKIFYFVGNGKDRLADMERLNVGATLESDFIETITNKHTKPLATPLLMSGKTTITEVSTPGDKPLELKVQLKRRMARMDIDNDPSVSNFDVKKILVSKTKLRGYVFENVNRTSEKSFEEGNYDEIEIKPKDETAPVRLDSVFYLYPTIIGEGKTEIALEGIFNGETKVYNLKIDTDVSAEANKRYVLKVKKVDLNKVDMEIKVADWEDEGEKTANPETDLVTFSAINHSAVKGIVSKGNDTYDLTGVTEAGKLTFTATSFNEKGSTAEVKYNWGNASSYSDLKINTPAPVLTYSSASYNQEYEIDIPNIDGSNVPVEMEITLRNAANPDQKKVIILYANRYADTKLYPILVGDIYWAPVNAGVSGPDAKVTDHGLLYQWGRNVGFAYEAGLKPVNDTIMGPMSAEEAETGKGKNKFILASKTPWDWLDIQDENRWNEENAQEPCPPGWRVPTMAELNLLIVAYGIGYSDTGKVNWNAVEKRVEIKGNNDEEVLYLPAAGFRHWETGLTSNRYASGLYWSSTKNTKNTLMIDMMEFSSSAFKFGVGYRARAYSLRCVQSAPTP